MRWIKLVLFCAVLSVVLAEPEPKKYKPEVKSKAKEENYSLTDEDRKFLREVEAKFGIKADVPVDEEFVDDDEDEKNKPETTKSGSVPAKLSFPAVIAIEIVNDTDIKNSKGKRTIDANLGYGYQTNNGYTYTYFGKSAQEKGKFMIYPYSQEDIPPANPNAGYSYQSSKTTKISPNVEITPSQAYELVPTNEERPEPYNYEKPAIEFKTKYEDAQGVETPPPIYPANENSAQHSPPSTTLYTTYNGEQFSGLSSQFPQVMSNYLVDPSQLLKNPQYQNVGLTQDHLRTHGDQLQQRVVPVLVLKIPSSYIGNPSAELYANLPQNYPLSQHLNNVNLQELVNQYFKKLGFTHAPQVMTYPSSPLAAPPSHLPASVSNYEPQHYASPYVQPSYTHADYSGVQYSAVQPVMARYPSGYTRQHYYITRGQMYQQPQHQQYVYRYRYVPQTALHTQNYYSRPQYEEGAHYQVVPQAQSEQVVEQEETAHETPQTEYGAQQPATYDESHLSAVEYETHQDQNRPQYEHHTQSVTSNYENVQTSTPAYETQYVSSTPDYGHVKAPVPEHGSSPTVQEVQYEESLYKEPSISVLPRGQTGHKFSVQYGSDAAHSQAFAYQNQHQSNDNAENDHGLALSENYPSKDHTIATVLPLSYKTRKQNEPIQSVSYVTPLPTVMKYHSHYRVMVPQTVLRHPTDEKVSYVNSHSLPTNYGQSGSSHQYNSEDEYTAPSHYIPPVGKQKPPSYPRNYHSHPKRMVKPENKSDTLLNRKQNERSEKKKSS